MSTNPLPPAAGCTRRVVASCILDECPISTGGATDGGSSMKVPHAGTLSFSGTGVDVKMSVDPDALGQYPIASPPGAGSRFLGGEAAKLVATGGDVPAFVIDTTYPLLLVLDQPTTTMGHATAPRTQDLSLAWSRGTSDVIFHLQGTSATSMFTKSIAIGCDVVSSTGSLTIPAAELARFNAGTTFTLATFGKATSRANAYEVDFYLGGEVLTPDKQNVVQITLQ